MRFGTKSLNHLSIPFLDRRFIISSLSVTSKISIFSRRINSILKGINWFSKGMNWFPERIYTVGWRINSFTKGINSFPERIIWSSKRINWSCEGIISFLMRINSFTEGINWFSEEIYTLGWGSIHSRRESIDLKSNWIDSRRKSTICERVSDY